MKPTNLLLFSFFTLLTNAATSTLTGYLTNQAHTNSLVEALDRYHLESAKLREETESGKQETLEDLKEMIFDSRSRESSCDKHTSIVSHLSKSKP